MPKKSNVMSDRGRLTSPVSSKERKEIVKRIKKEREQLQKLYPEVHGKAVDFITHSCGSSKLCPPMKSTT